MRSSLNSSVSDGVFEYVDKLRVLATNIRSMYLKLLTAVMCIGVSKTIKYTVAIIVSCKLYDLKEMISFSI